MLHNEKNSDCKQKPLIIYSALDWGLGHTTRSIVIIRELLKNGCKVVVACNSIQKEVLNQEFTGVDYVHLEGYNVKYGQTGFLTRMIIVSQLADILTKVKKEKRWLDTYLSENQADAVISDNRYGFYSPKIPSIFITHQLEPKTGMGKRADNFTRNFLYKYVNRFSECWIPDYTGHLSLAGDLSHPKKLPAPGIHYLGAISRLKEHAYLSENIQPKKILVILSGPEPQRSIFEEIIITQLTASKQNAILIRGLPGNNKQHDKLSNIQFFNYVSAAQLLCLIEMASIIICRPGYTSVMDMILLKKKMIVVPTPGQAEQEYLGNHLFNKKLAVTCTQKAFSLPAALSIAENFNYNFPERNGDAYKNVIKNFVDSLRMNRQ